MLLIHESTFCSLAVCVYIFIFTQGVGGKKGKKGEGETDKERESMNHIATGC